MLSLKAYRLATFVLFPLTTIAMSVVAYQLRYRPVELPPCQELKPIEDRRLELRQKIAEQEAESARVLETYSAENKVHHADLKTGFAEVLQKIPGVAWLEDNRVDKPTGRIIHFRDLHFVAKDLVALDMRQAYGHELALAEVDILFEQHLP